MPTPYEPLHTLTTVMLSHVAEIAALLGRLDALASPRTKAELLKCVGLANAYLNYKRHI